MEDTDNEAEQVAGVAYQVIGSLADAAGLFDHPEVQRALNWFSRYEAGTLPGNDLLPWGADLPSSSGAN